MKNNADFGAPNRNVMLPSEQWGFVFLRRGDVGSCADVLHAHLVIIINYNSTPLFVSPRNINEDFFFLMYRYGTILCVK